MNFPNRIIINDQDAWVTWHLLFLKGQYKELLKAPKRKENLAQPWNDQDGTERDVSALNFESRSLSIPCAVHGNTSAAAWLNYDAFINYIRTCGYFILEVPPLGMQFKLLYDNMASMGNPAPYYNQDGTTVLQFTLSLIDDFPFFNDTVYPLIDTGSDEGGEYLADADGEFLLYE